MSSTNKTEHLQLNQWVGTDPFRMSDFNADNQKIDAAIAAKANIVLGSYKGNGKYGQANPNSLTFPFTPKIIFLAHKSAGGGDAFMTFIYGQPVSCYNQCGTSSNAVQLTWSSNSVSWYCSANATYQFNINNGDFFYVAIG